MGMSNTLREYLDDQGTQYDSVRHPRTLTIREIAAAAHIAGEDFRALMARERRGHFGQHV